MKKKRDDSVYLFHILGAIQKIEEYVESETQKSFNEKSLIQDGVIRQLMIIGEAVKRLSKKLRLKYSSIPWMDIAGMRDKLVHDYFGIDLKTVWDAVKKDLPPLKIVVENILEDLETTGRLL